MIPKDFEWRSGRVLFWDMMNINNSEPLHAQLNQLKEDLVQVEFPNETILDIGWYPEFSPEGSFVLTVIRKKNWEEPLFTRKCSDISDLRLCIEQGIVIAEL